ncbi:4-coumarate--CoA ligase-like [Homarus americanus]|uniref:4-coumarate--CoA ligase-like n=1 Tax=Homarus americanus TaxID=6706 RepID=UPI001C45ACD1|nr:4-coumarate--CoA ligase-like [Homarus americanus]
MIFRVRAAGRGVSVTLRPFITRSCGAGVRPISTTWPAHHVTSQYPGFELPSGGNLTSYVLRNSSRWADKTATECAVTGRGYTYSQLVDRIARWGGMLTKLGIEKGDVVAVMMHNYPEYPIVILGATAIGAVVSTVNVSYTPGEVHGQLEDCGATLVVGDTLTEKTLAQAITLCKTPSVVVINGPSSASGALDLQQIIEDTSVPFADPLEVFKEDVAVMPYSSGTTGKSKGVLISHHATISSMHIAANPNFFWGSETTDCNQESILCYLPFYHAYGLVPIMMVWLQMGAKLVCVPWFDPNTFVRDISQHKVKYLHMVPTILNFLNHSPTVTPEAMASVKAVMCSAAPTAPPAAATFKDRLGGNIFFQESFGMTEAGLVCNTAKGRERLGSCGHLLPHLSAKVIDTVTGEELPPNQDGEICFKSPASLSGYLNNPAATAETIDSEGWIHSGDIGSFDEEGFFRIVDRTKEFIKVKGNQVAPSELEGLILQHPNVVEVGVVGVPDDRLGEVPRAYVVTSAPTTQTEIKEFVEPKLALFKRLAGGVIFINEIPKTATGKLLRKELRKMALTASCAHDTKEKSLDETPIKEDKL